MKKLFSVLLIIFDICTIIFVIPTFILVLAKILPPIYLIADLVIVSVLVIFETIEREINGIHRN